MHQHCMIVWINGSWLSDKWGHLFNASHCIAPDEHWKCIFSCYRQPQSAKTILIQMLHQNHSHSKSERQNFQTANEFENETQLVQNHRCVIKSQCYCNNKTYSWMSKILDCFRVKLTRWKWHCCHCGLHKNAGLSSAFSFRDRARKRCYIFHECTKTMDDQPSYRP